VTDLDTKLSFIVDPEAEPVDFDEVFAKYLLAFVREHGTSAEPT